MKCMQFDRGSERSCTTHKKQRERRRRKYLYIYFESNEIPLILHFLSFSPLLRTVFVCAALLFFLFSCFFRFCLTWGRFWNFKLLICAAICNECFFLGKIRFVLDIAVLAFVGNLNYRVRGWHGWCWGEAMIARMQLCNCIINPILSHNSIMRSKQGRRWVWDVYASYNEN